MQKLALSLKYLWYVVRRWFWGVKVKLGLEKPRFRPSVHALRKMYFRPTKAYADERQKAPWNRKRKPSKKMANIYKL
jgi:hypothetical protein